MYVYKGIAIYLYTCAAESAIGPSFGLLCVCKWAKAGFITGPTPTKDCKTGVFNVLFKHVFVVVCKVFVVQWLVCWKFTFSKGGW